MAELAEKNISPEDRRAAAAALGSVRSEKKTEAARTNGLKGGRKKGTPQSEETKRKISEARRRQEEARQAAA